MSHNNGSPKSAVEMLCDAVMAGMIEILRERNLVPADPSDAWCDRLAAAARVELKANMDEVLDEWSNAVEAPGLSDGWLKHMMVTQAAGIALEALQSGGFIEPAFPVPAPDAHLESAWEDQFDIG